MAYHDVLHADVKPRIAGIDEEFRNKHKHYIGGFLNTFLGVNWTPMIYNSHCVWWKIAMIILSFPRYKSYIILYSAISVPSSTISWSTTEYIYLLVWLVHLDVLSLRPQTNTTSASALAAARLATRR